jgi:alpha-galactosidase/6-phospho-beta-glucosidase family protein
LAGAGVIGICELPWTTLSALCGDAETAVHASFDYHGLNHVGWIYNLRIDGREMPDATPLKYLRLHYHTKEVVIEQRRTPAARVRRLIDIASRSFDVFAHGNRSDIEDALRARPAEWYPDAVVPLLRALSGWPVRIPLFLTRGDDLETEERCYRVVEGRLELCSPSAPPPPQVADVVSRFARYERVAADAVEHGSQELVVEALSLHPWVRSRDQASRLAHNVVGHPTGDGACVAFASR